MTINKSTDNLLNRRASFIFLYSNMAYSNTIKISPLFSTNPCWTVACTKLQRGTTIPSQIRPLKRISILKGDGFSYNPIAMLTIESAMVLAFFLPCAEMCRFREVFSTSPTKSLFLGAELPTFLILSQNIF